MTDRCCCCFFFFNDTATTEIYTLSLHHALPISMSELRLEELPMLDDRTEAYRILREAGPLVRRSEEHTSELQSPDHLVCRLLLEKKKLLDFTDQSLDAS